MLNKSMLSAACLFAVVISSACSKKPPPSADVATHDAAPAASDASAPAAAAPPAEALTVDQAVAAQDRAKKQSLLDYATMEDGYINDARAQWAASATASSTFGESNGETPSDSNKAANVVGVVDGTTWTNNSQNIGFDWLQTDYAKPVHATEVRVVFKGGDGVEAVSKVEVQDTDGGWSTVWSGLSDAKADERGSRTWFVRKFDKTVKLVKRVKITIANNVQSGYKVIDAVQLVGD